LAPKFLQQAAPKSLDTGPINKINKEGGPIAKGATGYKLKNVIVTSLEASVLEGRGVDGKGGTSSIRLGGGVDGKTGKAGIWSTSGTTGLSTGKASVLEGKGVDGKGGTSSYCTGHCISGSSGAAGSSSFRAGTAMNGKTGKAGIWLQNGGVDGVADRIGQCVGSSFPSVIDNTRASSLIPDPAVTFGAAAVLKNVLVSSYKATAAGSVVAFTDKDDSVRNLAPQEAEGLQEACANGTFLQGSLTIDTVPFELSGLPLLLAECMESKVGAVFLESHIDVSAAECVATVMPALSPKRAKQLGTYWQTQQQLSVWTNGNATSVWTNGNATSVWTNEE
jgi:hypothetical protein